MIRRLFEVVALIGFSSLLSSEANAHDFQSEEEVVLGESLVDVNLAPLSDLQTGVAQSVIDQYKLWEAGQVLKVCFFGGAPDVRQFFVDVSRLLDDVASISFDYGDASNFRNCDPSNPSHIRAAFTPGSSWSNIGTDSANADVTKPSLNVSVPNFALADRRSLGGTILHELGHALALKHEHQSPESHCDAEINWPAVYTALGGPPNNWDRPKVDHNLRQFVASPRLRVTPYDRKSIMHYSLASAWFFTGQQSSCWVARNNNLSATDVASIEEAYPPTPQQQDMYLSNLDVVSAATAANLKLNPESITLVQEAIDRSLGAVEGRNLQSAFSVNLSNIGAISTEAACSPVQTGNGNIEMTCTFPAAN